MDRPLPLFPNRLLSRILTIAAVGLLLLFCNISGSGSGSLLGPEAAHAQALTAVATVNVVIPPVTLLELLQKTPPRFVAVTSEGDHILEQAVHVQVRSNVPWQLNLLAPARLQVLIPQASPGTQDPDGPYYVLPGPRVLLFWAPHGSSSWQPLLPGRPVPVGPVSPPATGTCASPWYSRRIRSGTLSPASRQAAFSVKLPCCQGGTGGKSFSAPRTGPISR